MIGNIYKIQGKNESEYILVKIKGMNMTIEEYDKLQSVCPNIHKKVFSNNITTGNWECALVLIKSINLNYQNTIIELANFDELISTK